MLTSCSPCPLESCFLYDDARVSFTMMAGGRVRLLRGQGGAGYQPTLFMPMPSSIRRIDQVSIIVVGRKITGRMARGLVDLA